MNKHQIAEKLKLGEEVSWRPKGNSMTAKIKSGQLVTLSPINESVTLAKGDIVYCKVKGNYYLHLISAVKDGRYQISNNHGHVNGWTKNIYGILKKVEE